MTTKHAPATPLPWTQEQHDIDRCIFGYAQIAPVARLGVVNRNDSAAAHNAAYIAHAANAYPRLIEFARDVAARVPPNGDGATEAARALLRELGELDA